MLDKILDIPMGTMHAILWLMSLLQGTKVDLRRHICPAMQAKPLVDVTGGKSQSPKPLYKRFDGPEFQACHLFCEGLPT